MMSYFKKQKDMRIMKLECRRNSSCADKDSRMAETEFVMTTAHCECR